MKKYKIKHPTIILCSLFLIVAAYFLVPYSLFNLADYYTHQKGEIEKGHNFYQKIIKYFPYSPLADDSLYWLAASGAPSHGSQGGSNIIITRHMTSGPATTVQGAETETAIKAYKKLAKKYPQSNFAQFVPLRLGELYYDLGEYKKAEEYFLAGFTESKKQFVRSECNYKLIKLYLKSHAPEKALAMIQSYREENPTSMQPQIFLLEGDAYGQLKEFAKAEAAYLEALTPEDNLASGEPINSLTTEAKAKLAYNKWAKENQDQEKGTIKGEILRQGVPLEKVQIFLINENTARRNDYFSNLELELTPSTFTDTKGNFQFKDLIPGCYSLGLAIPANYLDGYTLVPRPNEIIEVKGGEEKYFSFQLVPLIKPIAPEINSHHPGEEMTFHWDNVPNATYYQLEIGAVKRKDKSISFSATAILDDIQDNKIILQASQLNKTGVISYDEQGVTPQSLLGSFYPGGEFIWNIKAFAADGTYLTESLGYQFHINKSKLPLFSTDSSGLSEGDKLILARKYDEALTYFQDQLAKKPADIHSLEMVSRLHQYYTEDRQKAVQYLEDLYQLTGSQVYLEDLALYLYHNKEYQKALPYLESLVNKDSANWYIFFALGRSYLLTGDTQLGEKYYTRALATGKCTRIDPILLLAARGDWTGAYQNLEKLNNHSLANFAPLKRLISDFKVNPPQDKETNWQKAIIQLLKDKESQINSNFTDKRLAEFLDLVKKSI